MLYKTLNRQEMTEFAKQASGETLVHTEGPARGRPLGQRHIARIVANFIQAQKRAGTLIEERPARYDQAGHLRLPRRYTLVPRNLDMFVQSNAEAEQGPERPRAAS